MSYESIMAGTEVQEVKTRLRVAAENYERQVAEIVGAEATGQGFNAPGFEKVRDQIAVIQVAQKPIVDFCVDRIVKKYEDQGLA